MEATAGSGCSANREKPYLPHREVRGECRRGEVRRMGA